MFECISIKRLVPACLEDGSHIGWSVLHQCLDHHDLLISDVALWQVTFSVLITMTSLYLVLLCDRSPSVSWSPWPPYIWCCFVTGHLQCLDHHDLLISDVALWQVTFSALITMTCLYLMLLCDRSPSVSWSPWPPYIWCCFVTGHLQLCLPSCFIGPHSSDLECTGVPCVLFGFADLGFLSV